MMPPLGGYYVYGEASAGRYYRPLFKHSLYPALAAGMFAPIRLEPGAERSGYLYFALPKESRDAPCELQVRACVPIGTKYALPGHDFAFSRDEVLFDGTVTGEKRERGETGSCDAPYGYLFSLGGTGKGDKSDLFFCRVVELAPDADTLWTPVASIASKSAAIADVSCRGSLAACAVNFKSKSKVFLMRCGGGLQVFEEKLFSRRIDRVFLYGGGAFVVTADGFCHRFDGSTHRWGSGVKLGTDIGDTALLRDYLVAFARREVRPFETSNLYPLMRRKGSPLDRGERRVIGLIGESLALLHRGSSTAPDTIAIFDIERGAEMRRGGLPGKVVRASTIGSNIVLQLEDGALLRIQSGPLGTFKIAESGYLPFAVAALRAAPHGFIAIGEGGEFAVGGVGDFRPGTKGAVELSAMVR